MPEIKSRPIFVSHAATDKAIAEKVVDLLNTGMAIDVQKDVFCTSLEGLKIPPGSDFKQFIKDQIQEPKLVLLLISQNYLASQFCLAEVGASWAMSHRIIPILVPPIVFSDMKAVLAGVNATRIDDPSDWNEALAIFKEVLGIDPNINRWERKRDEHIALIKGLLPQQPAPPVIPFSKFQELETQLADANAEIHELEVNNARCNETLEEIKALKDAKEVAQVELSHRPESEAFESLRQKAEKLLSQFNNEVNECFYYHFRGESPPPIRPGFSDSEDRWDDFRNGVEAGFINDEGELNHAHPRVAETLDALSKMRAFIEGHPDFASSYEQEHGVLLDLTLRPFWDEVLW